MHRLHFSLSLSLENVKGIFSVVLFLSMSVMFRVLDLSPSVSLSFKKKRQGYIFIHVGNVSYVRSLSLSLSLFLTLVKKVKNFFFLHLFIMPRTFFFFHFCF